MESPLALDDLVQIPHQHVVVTSTDVREVVPFEERLCRDKRSTPIAVPERLSLRDPVGEQRSRL